MKQQYEKPTVEKITFQVEEPLMTGAGGDIGGDLSVSYGGGLAGPGGQNG